MSGIWIHYSGRTKNIRKNLIRILKSLGVLEQAQSCAEQGNSYPFCSPMSSDVWTNGSTHSFIWNFKYVPISNKKIISLYKYILRPRFFFVVIHSTLVM